MANTVFTTIVLPFHVISENNHEDLFGTMQDNLLECEPQRKDWESLGRTIDKYGALSHDLADSSKYYIYLSNHWNANQKLQEESAHSFLRAYRLKKDTFVFQDLSGVTYKQATLNSQKKDLFLGDSKVTAAIHDVWMFFNEAAHLGYWVLQLKLDVSDERSSVLEALANIDFFRSIEVKGKQSPGKVSNQFKKFSFSICQDETNERIYLGTIQDFIRLNFVDFSPFIRFYQTRPNVLYLDSDSSLLNWDFEKLKSVFYSVIRVPDRNVSIRSDQEHSMDLSMPSSHIILAALNEGTIISEQVNASGGGTDYLAKKYFPAFLLAINQREVLLKTMHATSALSISKIMDSEDRMFELITNLKRRLTIIQLKQIFYSVSNTSEVETFFSKLLDVFKVEIILKDNRASLEELHEMIEMRRAELELERQKVEEERKQQEMIEEDRKAKIMNSILGIVSVLGLYSFIKDVGPFVSDDSYSVLLKVSSIWIPLFLALYLVKVIFYKSPK